MQTKILTSKYILAILLVCTLVVIGIYICTYTSDNKQKLGFVGLVTRQQYFPEPYFAKDIYIVPSQARLSHNINTKEYDNSYLPYENAIPAIDVLRANNNLQKKAPSYYTQVIRHNTSPYPEPLIATV